MAAHTSWSAENRRAMRWALTAVITADVVVLAFSIWLVLS